VYAAYDPELGRRVAVKLLAGIFEDEGEYARLLREARVLASITHPSVITVHDAGEYDLEADGLGWGVFMVLELFESLTVDRWIAATSPTVDAIVDVFVQVGRGLIAAHDAGLVHRDVKPRNILVASDGRAVLADFGIACGDRTTSRGSSTTSGTGTPRYMAPEQRRGAAPQPAADQWSFCATMWTALSGESPKAVRDGPWHASAKLSHVPRHVRRALVRGLSPEAKDRFPGMASLVARLDRKTRSRSALALGGVLGTSLTLAAWLGWGWSQTPGCAGARAKLAQAWPDARAGQVRARLAGLPGLGAGPAAELTAALDAQADAWMEASDAACRRNLELDGESAALADRRVACLEHSLASLHAVGLVLQGADESTGRIAPSLVRRVRPPAPCLDDPPHVEPLPEALDFKVAAAILEASILGATGDVDGAQSILDTIEPAAIEPMLAARWYGAWSIVHNHRGQPELAEADLVQGVRLGELAGDHEFVARLQIDMMHAMNTEGSRHVEANRLAEQIQARAESANLGPGVLAALALTRGNLATARGRTAEAVEHFERLESLCVPLGCGSATEPMLAAGRLGRGGALLKAAHYSAARLAFAAHARQTRRAPNELVGQAWMSRYNLGLVAMDVGMYEEARQWLLEASELGSPNEWRFDYALAQIAYRQDEPDAALAHLDRAQDKLGRAAPRSVWRLSFDALRASVEQLRGNHAEALEQFESIHAQTQRELGDDNPRTLAVLEQVATAEFEQGQLHSCLKRHQDVLRRRLASVRPQHPSVARSQRGVARCLAGLGRHDQAVPLFERARASVVDAVGPLAPELFEIDSDLAHSYAAVGKVADARSLLLEALARYPDTEAPARDEAMLWLALAQIRREPSAAQEAAQRALSLFSDLGPRYSVRAQAAARVIDVNQGRADR